MRSPLVAALALMLLSGCATYSDVPDPDERLSSQTVLQIELIASADRFDVESSQLALEKSQVPAVRDFASRMVDAHPPMSDELLAAARTVRAATPAFALISNHFAMLERLRHAGPEFDSLYRDFQVQVHQEAIALDQGYAASGNVPALAAVARDELPVEQAHLGEARQLPVPPTPAPAPLPSPLPPPPPAVQAGERG